MSIQSLFQTLHDKAPKLGKKASLLTATVAVTANSVAFGLPLLLVGVAKVTTKNKLADKMVVNIAEYWIRVNNQLISNILPKKDWRISLPESLNSNINGNANDNINNIDIDNIDVSGLDKALDPNKQYLLICNHQSWIDTSIIQYVSHYPKNRLPLTRFFTKFELIYIPFVGQAFYFLDFPMMKRHSKEAIAKNPALKGKDIEEAKRACNLLKSKPFTLLNYLEGTRFSPEKKQKQNPPYQYLLKPKAGGLSLAISALGEQIDGILDMTIVYPDYPNQPPSYGELWRGNIKRLGVDIRHLDMPTELFDSIKNGGYSNDEQAKAEMFAWIDQVWQEKDQRIHDMLKDFDS